MPKAAKVKVPVTVLKQHGDARLSPSRFFTGMRDLVESNKKVLVETNPYNQTTSVLYASDAHTPSRSRLPFQPTEFITVSDKDRRPRLVQSDDDFEINIVGLCVSSYDKFSFNEVLMYSLKANDEDEMNTGRNIPFIHYDPIRDGSGVGTAPNTFIPIPASKSLFLSYDGKTMPENDRKKQVMCQFHILELDGAIEGKEGAISGIGDLGHFASQFASAIPSFGTLDPVISAASEIGKAVISKWSQPDMVLNKNIKFLLNDSRTEKVKQIGSASKPTIQDKGIKTGGDYLRYGYYFFLSQAVDLKLYASTNASSQNVQLLLRRRDRISEGETEYFPLVGVSYLVIRVTRGLSTNRKTKTRKPIQLSHAKRLEQLLNESSTADDDESQKNILSKFMQLAKDIGAPNAQDFPGDPSEQSMPGPGMDPSSMNAGIAQESSTRMENPNLPMSHGAQPQTLNDMNAVYTPDGDSEYEDANSAFTHVGTKPQAIPNQGSNGRMKGQSGASSTMHLPPGAATISQSGGEIYFPPGNEHFTSSNAGAAAGGSQTLHIPKGAVGISASNESVYFPPGNEHFSSENNRATAPGSRNTHIPTGAVGISDEPTYFPPGNQHFNSRNNNGAATDSGNSHIPRGATGISNETVYFPPGNPHFNSRNNPRAAADSGNSHIPRGATGVSDETVYFPPGNEHFSSERNEETTAAAPELHTPAGAAGISTTEEEVYFPPGNEHFTD